MSDSMLAKFLAARSTRRQSARKSDLRSLESRRALQITYMARERQREVKGETPPKLADLTNPKFINRAAEHGMSPRELYVYLGGDIKALPKSALYQRVAKIADRQLRWEEQERDEDEREP